MKKLVLLAILITIFQIPAQAQQAWDDAVRVPFMKDILKDGVYTYYSCENLNTYITWNDAKRKHECVSEDGLFGQKASRADLKKMTLNEIVSIHHYNPQCKSKRAVGFIPDRALPEDNALEKYNAAWIMIKCNS